MATILIQKIHHKTNPYAGAGGIDHAVAMNLGEDLDFQNVEFLKRGGFPIGFDGKLLKATTAKPIAGFYNPQQIGSLSPLVKDFQKKDDIMVLISDFVATVDTAKPAGTPVYIDDNGQFSDKAGTTTMIVGYYKYYDPRVAGTTNTTTKFVDFSVRFM